MGDAACCAGQSLSLFEPKGQAQTVPEGMRAAMQAAQPRKMRRIRTSEEAPPAPPSLARGPSSPLAACTPHPADLAAPGTPPGNPPLFCPPFTPAQQLTQRMQPPCPLDKSPAAAMRAPRARHPQADLLEWMPAAEALPPRLQGSQLPVRTVLLQGQWHARDMAGILTPLQCEAAPVVWRGGRSNTAP